MIASGDRCLRKSMCNARKMYVCMYMRIIIMSDACTDVRSGCRQACTHEARSGRRTHHTHLYKSFPSVPVSSERHTTLIQFPGPGRYGR